MPGAIRSQALAARAVMEIAANMFDRARLTLWRAVRLDRRNAAAWYHLGHLSRDTYRFEDAALEQFEMASRLMKDPARAKAIARDTIPALRETLSKYISEASAGLEREAYEAAKFYDSRTRTRNSAINAYERFLREYPASSYADVVRERLAQLKEGAK